MNLIAKILLFNDNVLDFVLLNIIYFELLITREIVPFIDNLNYLIRLITKLPLLIFKLFLKK